jgi:hypothetical protein
LAQYDRSLSSRADSTQTWADRSLVPAVLILFSIVAGLGLLCHLGVLPWAENSFTGPEAVVAAQAMMLAHDGTLYYDLNHYPYTVCAYMPTLYLLEAGLYKLGLPAYTAGRLISFGAMLGIFALSWQIVLLYTRDRYCALDGGAVGGVFGSLAFLGDSGAGGHARGDVCPGGVLPVLALRDCRGDNADLGRGFRTACFFHQTDYASLPGGHLRSAVVPSAEDGASIRDRLDGGCYGFGAGH